MIKKIKDEKIFYMVGMRTNYQCSKCKKSMFILNVPKFEFIPVCNICGNKKIKRMVKNKEINKVFATEEIMREVKNAGFSDIDMQRAILGRFGVRLASEDEINNEDPKH